jgi:hypothetical protein
MDDKPDDLKQLGQRLAAGGWKVVGAVGEGQSILLGGFVFGVNPWRYQWQSLSASVAMPHPAYPNQMHSYHIYQIKTWRRRIIFAAGELSAGVFGFCVPARFSR